MNRFIYRPLFVAIAIVALSVGSAFARSSVKTATVEIKQNARLANGPQISAGTYKIELSEANKSPEVMFYQDGKMVASAPAQVVNEKQKADETSVIVDNHGKQQVITEIDPSGWTQRVIFGNSSNTTHSGS